MSIFGISFILDFLTSRLNTGSCTPKSAKEREGGRENMNAFCLFVSLFIWGGGAVFLMMDLGTYK